MIQSDKARARQSRAAIERLYIIMRHLFIRGYYKPNGVSGEALKSNLLELQPEIYGDMAHPERVELRGLLYVMERLPEGIEECRYIHLIAREGFEGSGFEPIIPAKRRRNCYRIDRERMYVELTRGRSDIYDILTHLTFLFIEAEKIKHNGLDEKNRVKDDWKRLEEMINLQDSGQEFDEHRAFVYLSSALGRTVEETANAVRDFDSAHFQQDLYHIVYWLGRIAIEEGTRGLAREIKFSSKLREIIGHHVYGEQWADKIKSDLAQHNWSNRPLHIISANLHSVINCIYSAAALEEEFQSIEDLAYLTVEPENSGVRNKIRAFAEEHGMHEIKDQSGTNLTVQLIDLAQISADLLPPELQRKQSAIDDSAILLVMDYAFGEQAYECMEELLKPYLGVHLNVQSISIIGKAGTLTGEKGDILIPTAHVFEGTADNYPIENDLSVEEFEGFGLQVSKGTMITVLGTSLQNRDVLEHFLTSTWNAIGLEMEGAHYQKAIQSATQIRKSIHQSVKVRYAYYASDNPLVSGGTLASGSLGKEGVKPTYLITRRILEKILYPNV